MAKSEKVEVWVVRFKPPDPGVAPYGALYMLYPFEPQPWRGDKPDLEAVWITSSEFEKLWPQCRLAPGGGPVKVR